MNVLICGGRNFTDESLIGPVIEALDPGEDVVIHGGAPGADLTAGKLARRRGVHSAVVFAHWDEHGPAAGPLRNQAMLHLDPDKVIAFPGGRGTENCIRQAEALGIPVERVACRIPPGEIDRALAPEPPNGRRRFYLGIEVIPDERIEGGWVWAIWPDGRRFQHWAEQLKATPWGLT